MIKICFRCHREFEGENASKWCIPCGEVKKAEWRRHSNYRLNVKCQKCGKVFEGWYKTMFCEKCRPAERYKLQVVGIDKFNKERRNGVVPYVSGEVWAKLILAMANTCNGKRELYVQYEWCWDCSVNYFCQNAILNLTESRCSVLH